MAHTDENNDLETDLREPERLRDDLSALYGSRAGVPEEVDSIVLGMVRRHFVRYRRARWLVRTAAVGAAAASIVLVVWFARSGAPPVETAGPEVAGVREDINGDGRIDVRDALLLAQRIEATPQPKRDWDINGDGAVDRRDVDTVAMAAVRLDGGSYQ